MKIQRKSLFLFWAWMDLFFVLQFLWWNIAHRRLPFYDDLLAYLQLLHTGIRGGLAVPAECSADYQHPAIDDLFSARAAMRCGWPGAGAAQAAVYAAFAIAGPVADSGCRRPACSDLAGFLLLSEGLKIASLWYCRGGIQGIKR